MFDQILVPLDGSSTAQIALPAALSLAVAFNSTIELVHVLSQEADDKTIQVDPLNWHMRKAEVETYLSAIGQTLACHNLKTKQSLLKGAVAERIISYAADQEADLIIISSHGNSGLTGWNVSSDAQKIIARANRSVLLMRAFQQLPVDEEQIEPLPLHRLVVPLDGSRRAEGILPIASKIAAAHGATVWLVHVSTLASLMLPFKVYNEDLFAEQTAAPYHEAAKDYLYQLQTQLECPTQIAVVQGETVVGALNHFVKRESIDLMLLCAHGQADGHHPYGSIVTSIVYQGNASLFIFQDLRPDEIEPTQAEVASNKGYAELSRESAHAQPAFWTP